MIRLENVSKVYGSGTVAVEDVTMEIERGEVVTLVGPSGCGKTTTMEMVNNLTPPTDGTIYIDGQAADDIDPIELRRDIGYVIQEIGLFKHMTIAENIGIVPDIVGWDDDRIAERVDELLDLIQLPDEVREKYPVQLSGGQRQRVGVARALAANPDVILMDEPFGALDPITREQLQDEFLRIQEGLDVTIVFVTHDINEALKMGDRVAVMRSGRLVQYATPRELLAEPANEFVESFIGEDRLLKELGTIRVDEAMGPPEQAAADSVSGLGPDESLRNALQRLFTASSPVPVVADGEVVGSLSETDIKRAVGDDSNAVLEGGHA